MCIAKIVAPLTCTPRDKEVLAMAFAAAKPFKAHVVALFVRPDPRLALPYTGIPISPEVVQAIVDSAEQMNREAAVAARATLKSAAATAQVAIVKAPEKANAATCSFEEMEGYFPTCVSDAARLSDLVVFGPITTADSPDLAEAFSETLIKTERPVLLASRARAAFPGKVFVAWDDSATAARALVGAIPYLKHAREIVLLSCGRLAHLKEVERYLACHGVSCVGQTVDPGKLGIGETLLESATKGGADLLVMGGYGHSQLGETIFGGVTHHVRWHASVPVLMIH